MTLTRRGLLWAVAALLGIAVTAALTWSVSRLAAEHIGLSSEPISVIHGLAPPHSQPHPRSAASNGHSTMSASGGNSMPTIALPSTPQLTSTATTLAAAPPQTQTPASPPGPLVARTAAAQTTGGDHPDDSRGGGSGGHHSGPDD